jgi:hypothetical protein
MMNKSEGAIKSLYFRTLSTLRKELEGMGWGPDDGEQDFAEGVDIDHAERHS